MALAAVFERLRLPPLLGMLAAGIVLGPGVLDALDGSLGCLGRSAEGGAAHYSYAPASAWIAQLAAETGRPAVLMCFVPACFEICAVTLLAPALLGFSLIEAAVLGSVLAAVSPAVVVPKMLRLMDEATAAGRGVPDFVAASVDQCTMILGHVCVLFYFCRTWQLFRLDAGTHPHLHFFWGSPGAPWAALSALFRLQHMLKRQGGCFCECILSAW